MSGSGSRLTLLAGSELGKITVVVTLPVFGNCQVRNGISRLWEQDGIKGITVSRFHSHLVVEDLGLARGSVRDKGVVQDVEDILADLLELQLDFSTVLLDGADVLVGALGLFLLLDGRDDAPGSTAGSDDVLVGHAEQVALVDGELTAELGNLLHVGDHLIVALGLLAQSGEESLAAWRFVRSVFWARVGLGHVGVIKTNLSR